MAPLNQSECDLGSDCVLVENPGDAGFGQAAPQHKFICLAPAHTLYQKFSIFTAISLIMKTCVGAAKAVCNMLLLCTVLFVIIKIAPQTEKYSYKQFLKHPPDFLLSSFIKSRNK